MMVWQFIVSLLVVLFGLQAADGNSGEGASSTATLDGILGQGEPIGDPAQSTTPGTGAGTSVVEEREPEAGTETAEEGEVAPVEGEEPAEGEEAEVEETVEGEEDLAPGEGEVDYSDAVYQRYAQHFQKTRNLAQPLNIQDPATRAMLHEIIQRGENFRRLQEEHRQPEEGEEAEAEAGTEEVNAEAAPTGDTPEQVAQFIGQVDKLAESLVRPEVAKVFLTDFMTNLWGDKGKAIAEKARPEQAVAFTKTMTKFGFLFLNDALPRMLETWIPGFMSNQYPGFDQVQQDAVHEAAFESLANARDRAGNQLYPDIEDLVFGEGGELEAVYQAHPELVKMKFADERGKLLPPVQQASRRLEMAIAYARGQQPAPELLQGAAEAGRRQARRQAQVTSAGRLAPGESGGTFERTGDSADDLLKGMSNFGDRDRVVQDMLAPKK